MDAGKLYQGLALQWERKDYRPFRELEKEAQKCKNQLLLQDRADRKKGF